MALKRSRVQVPHTPPLLMRLNSYLAKAGIASRRKADDLIKAEKVMVNGDPDADGITGAAVLVAGMRHLGGQVLYDFPTRSKEGHGIQPRIINEAIKQGCKLLITADCGTKEPCYAH